MRESKRMQPKQIDQEYLLQNCKYCTAIEMAQYFGIGRTRLYKIASSLRRQGHVIKFRKLPKGVAPQKPFTTRILYKKISHDESVKLHWFLYREFFLDCIKRKWWRNIFENVNHDEIIKLAQLGLEACDTGNYKEIDRIFKEISSLES
jgi:hypothetical protein